jgi:glycosyltransferase 2 family protein
VTKKHAIQLAVSILIGGACLYFAFRGVDWSDLGARLQSVPWYAHLLYLGALVVMYVLRTERWAIQARGIGMRAPTQREALALNAVGFAAVFLLPFRLGEFARPVLAKQRKIMSVSAGLAVTALERIFDGIITTGFFGLVMLLMRDRQVPAYVTIGGWTALMVFGGALVVLALAFRWREASVRFWHKLIGIVHQGLADKLVRMLRSFLDGLACFPTLSSLAAYLGLSIAYWMLNGASMWMLLRFMGIDAEPLAAFFCLCFLVIGVMIPAPPGNVGNFHAFAKAALVIFGVSEGDAVAYAVVLHGWQTLGVILWGGLFLATRDVSLSGMHLSEQANDTSRQT